MANKNLKKEVLEVIKHIEEAHKILEEAKTNKYEHMFVQSADSFLVHALNDLTHLDNKL